MKIHNTALQDAQCCDNFHITRKVTWFTWFSTRASLATTVTFCLSLSLFTIQAPGLPNVWSSLKKKNSENQQLLAFTITTGTQMLVECLIVLRKKKNLKIHLPVLYYSHYVWILQSNSDHLFCARYSVFLNSQDWNSCSKFYGLGRVLILF